MPQHDRQRCLLINKNIWTVKNRKDFVSAGPESRWEQSINFSQRMNVFRKLSSRQVERVTLLQKTKRSSQLGTKQIALYMHVFKIETYKSCAHANRLRCFTSETCLLWHSCINFSALWRCKCFPLLLVHGMFFQSAVWTLIHAFFTCKSISICSSESDVLVRWALPEIQVLSAILMRLCSNIDRRIACAI